MKMIAPDWTSSTFGWSGTNVVSKDGRLIDCPPGTVEEQAGVAEATVILTPEQKRTLAPFFTVGFEKPVESIWAIEKQTIANEIVCVGTYEDLQPFRQTLGRYAVLIRAPEWFLNAASADNKLFMRLAAVLLRYSPAALLLYQGAVRVGVVVDRLLLLGRYVLPRGCADPILDLIPFLATFGEIGEYDCNGHLEPALRAPRPFDITLFRGREPYTYSAGLLAQPPTAQDRHFASVCLNAYPGFLPKAQDPSFAPGLWTCHANEWYDHGRILRRYIGLDAEIQIDGKIQHGWQSGCGIDGERGYKPEAVDLGFPIYVWSQRNLDACRADGLDRTNEVKAIGAPILYADFGADPGPANKSLLCFPYHSIPEYQIATDWRVYGEGVLRTARDLGFESATICLHWHDYENEVSREALRGIGIEVVTLGAPESPKFLHRFALLVREHAAVTSDRICSAGMYASALGRPFFLSGTPLVSDPPDPDYGLGSDLDWIGREMPEFLKFDGQVHMRVALRELGIEFRQTRAQLAQTLYGWMLP